MIHSCLGGWKYETEGFGGSNPTLKKSYTKYLFNIGPKDKCGENVDE